MFSNPRIDPVILGHILGQHRELHAQVLALRAAFAARPDASRLDAVRRMLLALRDHLQGHFEQEEQGGFMEESIARMPRLSSAVRDVMADHPRLLAELDALLERLPVGDVSRVAWDEASRDFDSFAEHLLLHERNEHAVVQEGYNEDLGLFE
ncbi:MAG: hemerythrin domain-containing protein [Pirellulales bacterium]